VTLRLKIPQLILFDDQQNLLNYAAYNRYIEEFRHKQDQERSELGERSAGYKVLLCTL
jgi:hypothetical protein